MSRKREDKGTQAPAGPFNNPFGALKDRLGGLPDAPARAPAREEPKGPARAVVRLERKGHGGKEVTVVEKLGLAPRELDGWLRDLKRSLGCGGVVDGDTLVFQGDQRDRLEPALTARGVRKVTLG